MTADAELHGLFDEALIVAEMARAVKERWAELRESAAPKGIDWSQLKALAVDIDADHQDGGDRCGKLITKADFACSYAGRLGLHKDERKNEIRSSPPSRSVSRPTPASLDVQTAGSEPADENPQSAGSPKSAPGANLARSEPADSRSPRSRFMASTSDDAMSRAAGPNEIPGDLSIPEFLRRDQRLAS